MKQYIICNQPDDEVFQRQCAVLMKHIPNLIEEATLQDVDGSVIRRFTLFDKEIIVKNDYYIGGVFIQSEINLEKFF